MEIGSLADRSPDGVSQNKIIQELMKRLRDGGLLPDELPNNGKNRSEANWTADESI